MVRKRNLLDAKSHNTIHKDRIWQVNLVEHYLKVDYNVES